MCMNLQAEGVSNVLEYDVNAHHEVSKSLRSRTKKRKMQKPSAPQYDFEKPLFSICPAWRIPGSCNWWPRSSWAVWELSFSAWTDESSSNRTGDLASCTCLSPDGIQKPNLGDRRLGVVTPRALITSPGVCTRQKLLTEASEINWWDECRGYSAWPENSWHTFHLLPLWTS